MEPDVSIAVVGLGLIGSAALRHASATDSAVGIGPAEPEDWSIHSGAFASHYDSGRITRRLDARQEWAVLASRSIDAYPLIEKLSGMAFHSPVGMAYVRNDDEGIEQQRGVADRLGIEIDDGPAPAPYRFGTGWTCLFEPAPAGHIDPRKMIDAQHTIARANGAETIRYEATEVRRLADAFVITAADGTEISAGELIVATGSYGDAFTGKPLAASIRSEAVILCEMEAQVAERLDMPTAIWLIDHPDFIDIYVVPPVQYPDGRWYLKVGGNWTPGPRLDSERKRHSWMSGHDADGRLTLMRDIVGQLLPDLPFISFSMKPCLITDTATGLPYIGIVDNGVVVARGGNGHAAKSADAIGAVAVELARNGSWTDPELDEDAFRPQFANQTPKDT